MQRKLGVGERIIKEKAYFKFKIKWKIYLKRWIKIDGRPIIVEIIRRTRDKITKLYTVEFIARVYERDEAFIKNNLSSSEAFKLKEGVFLSYSDVGF